jgi:hypothetical protein
MLIMLCDCPLQGFEFCSHIKIFINLRYTTPFLASSQNLKKNFVMSVCRPSVRLSARWEYLGSQWTGFHEIQCLRIFRKTLVS